MVFVNLILNSAEQCVERCDLVSRTRDARMVVAAARWNNLQRSREASPPRFYAVQENFTMPCIW